MHFRQTTALFIGILVCVIVLALSFFGAFEPLASMLEGALAQHLRLAGALRRGLPLQYAHHTAMAFLTAWVCLGLSGKGMRWAFMGAALFLTLTFTLVMALQGVLFEPFSGALAVVLSGLAAMICGSSVCGRLVAEYRSFFVGRLAESQFERLVGQREPTRLSGQREVTVLSLQLTNSLALTHALRPEPLATMSAAVLKAASEALIARGAYIERCGPQGITALFGFPVAGNDHAQQACRVALEMRPVLARLAQEARTRFMAEARFGIGLASGKVVGGLYGHGPFQSFSALGEPLVMAEKLAALNAAFATKVLIAANTLSRARTEIEVRPIDIVSAVSDYENEVEIHELLAARGGLLPEDHEAREHFADGIAMLRAGQAAQALAKFKQALQPDQEDAAVLHFIGVARAAAAPKPAVASAVAEVAPAQASEATAPATRLKPLVSGVTAATTVSVLRPVTSSAVPRVEPTAEPEAPAAPESKPEPEASPDEAPSPAAKPSSAKKRQRKGS